MIIKSPTPQDVIQVIHSRLLNLTQLTHDPLTHCHLCTAGRSDGKMCHI